MPSTDTFGEALATATKERVPFAVVQDVSDKTHHTYGIDGFPMFCIIGASGKAVKYCNFAQLRFFVMAELIKNRRLQGAAPVAVSQPR